MDMNLVRTPEAGKTAHSSKVSIREYSIKFASLSLETRSGENPARNTVEITAIPAPASSPDSLKILQLPFLSETPLTEREKREGNHGKIA